MGHAGDACACSAAPGPFDTPASRSCSLANSAQTSFFLAVRSLAASLFRVVRSIRCPLAKTNYCCSIRMETHLFTQTHGQVVALFVASPKQPQPAVGVTFFQSGDVVCAD